MIYGNYFSHFPTPAKKQPTSTHTKCRKQLSQASSFSHASRLGVWPWGLNGCVPFSAGRWWWWWSRARTFSTISQSLAVSFKNTMLHVRTRVLFIVIIVRGASQRLVFRFFKDFFSRNVLLYLFVFKFRQLFKYFSYLSIYIIFCR